MGICEEKPHNHSLITCPQESPCPWPFAVHWRSHSPHSFHSHGPVPSPPPPPPGPSPTPGVSLGVRPLAVFLCGQPGQPAPLPLLHRHPLAPHSPTPFPSTTLPLPCSAGLGGMGVGRGGGRGGGPRGVGGAVPAHQPLEAPAHQKGGPCAQTQAPLFLLPPLSHLTLPVPACFVATLSRFLCHLSLARRAWTTCCARSAA